MCINSLNISLLKKTILEGKEKLSGVLKDLVLNTEQIKYEQIFGSSISLGKTIVKVREAKLNIPIEDTLKELALCSDDTSYSLKVIPLPENDLNAEIEYFA